MSAEKEAESLAGSLKSIFEKVGQFLDLFDLSFFISGAAATGAGWLWLVQSGRMPPLELSGWQLTFAVAVVIYCSGLICFACGRNLRHWKRLVSDVAGLVSGVRGVFSKKGSMSSFLNPWKKLTSVLDQGLKDHQIGQRDVFQAYLTSLSSASTAAQAVPSPPASAGISTGERDSAIRALYARLWAELRCDPRMTGSLSLLNRYWVMAATYDGLAFALLLWLAVAASFTWGWGMPADILSPELSAAALILLAIAVAACLREAMRYAEYQMHELVASTAARLSLPPLLAPPAGVAAGAPPAHASVATGGTSVAGGGAAGIRAEDQPAVVPTEQEPARRTTPPAS